MPHQLAQEAAKVFNAINDGILRLLLGFNNILSCPMILNG
jgi:hypothetical protein